MEAKPLLYGIVGFIAGGLLVSIAATTFNNVASEDTTSKMQHSLVDKTGEAYDAAFIAEMINHHQDAIDMAKHSEKHAHHKEIKDLSTAIIAAQEKEINEMKQWQTIWGFKNEPTESGLMKNGM